MSDVSVAPAGNAPTAAPASPAPASREIPIATNAVNIPTPVGSQAPSADPDMKGSTHRPQSRREAIQAAFDRAANPKAQAAKPAERPAPRAAEAKPGHNQPPEQTPRDAPLDLKRRPDDQPKAGDRARGDHGHFVSRETPATNNQQSAQGNAQQQTTNQAQQGRPNQQTNAQATNNSASNYGEPPPRMAEHAKRDWHQVPETVRGEVYRVHREFNKAFQYYKPRAEAFEPIAKYHELAQQQGTTLEKALSNYVSMEYKLREDPVAGLDTIVNNLGLKGPNGEPIGLRDIAYHVLTQSPEQLKQTRLGNNQQAAAMQIGALHQEIVDLRNTLQRMQDEQVLISTRSVVDKFADTHPRLDELGKAVENELRLGFDLETAYRRAELLYPTTQAAQTRTPSAQTRTVDKSISGAPGVAPSNGAFRQREVSSSAREAAANALRQVRSGAF